MADAPKPTGNPNAAYNPSPNALSTQDYQTIQAEREDLVKKQLAAPNEFMHLHYERLLRTIEVSFERATKANLILERKQRRATAKQRKESFQKQTPR
jgi:hypothetical protein